MEMYSNVLVVVPLNIYESTCRDVAVSLRIIRSFLGDLTTCGGVHTLQLHTNDTLRVF